MKGVKYFLSLVERVFLVFAVCSMGIMFVTNMVQVCLRYVFNTGLDWIYPLTMLLFIWMTFLGSFVIYHQKKDIVMNYIVTLFPPRFQKGLLLITNALTIVLLVIILKEAPTILRQQASIMQVIPLPRYFQSIPLFVGCGGILLEYVVSTYEAITGLGTSPTS
jgi:TRAP-type C4-dicarboxylate transport system permease small subunit